MTNATGGASLDPSRALAMEMESDHSSSKAVTRKGERSRSGCITCRARKVKCDEHPGACLNCGRLGVDCAGYSSKPLSKSARSQLRAKKADHTLTEAGLERKRLRSSCRPCRKSKTRCSGDRPTCTRCRDKTLKCHYDSRKGRSDSPGETLVNDSLDGPQGSPLQTGSYVSSIPQQSPRIDHLNSTSQDHLEPPQRESLDGTHNNIIPAGTLLPHWLFYSHLPNTEQIHQLVDAYFTHMHPLRCFAFIHRPSFMEKLDQDLKCGRHDSAILNIICALGAKFYAIMPPSFDEQLESKHILLAGTQWAKNAQREIFDNMNHISVEYLMATILLYDHELRIGNHASAFMLSGATARMSQALQINLEYSKDILCTEEPGRLSFCARESRRRLMWSCYVLDSWVGSGVDQLTLIEDKDIRIQLPCNERNFLQQIPSITESITEGQFLRFIPNNLKPTDAKPNMGIMAQFIRVSSIRKRTLSYLKTIDTSQSPTLPDPEFSQLETMFREWYELLPSTHRLTPTSIYTRKDSGQLGALFLMHFTYHISLCDLYRLSMPMLLPGLLKKWANVNLTPDQQSFRIEYQRKCFERAKSVAEIFSRCIEHGPRTLTDTWLPTCAFESLRTMLYYSVEGMGHTSESGRQFLYEVTPLCRANMRSLKMMIPLFATAERCYITATSLVRKAGLGQLAEGAPATDDQLLSHQLEIPIDHNAPATESPEHVLNPLSIYALTRQDLDGKDQDHVAPRHHARSYPSPRIPVSKSAPNPQKLLPTYQPPLVQNVTSVPSANYSTGNAQNIATQNITSIPDTSYMASLPPIWPEPDMPLNLDPFWMNINSDLDGSWMPAETFQENAFTRGLPPWATGLPDEQFQGTVL
ncbi:hypothetical protein EG329_001540 [Mollisiaceae sp. DMI_Dod_QoI]|nr:hypothetical protein EG329_001540 [Helotiales sp. DMI_Dod_QoI]